jgi:thiol-disulfide isomerase/thioredoxin
MKPFLLLAAALAAGLLPVAALAQTPAANPADLSQYPTADALWLHIQDVQKGPKTHPATQEEYKAVVADTIAQIAISSTEFLKRYPNDPRRWDARLYQIQASAAIDGMEGHADDARLAGELLELGGETDAPPAVRGHARYEVLVLSLHRYEKGDTSVTTAAILAQLGQFVADFPTYPSLDALKYKVAETLDRADPNAAAMLLKELAASGQGQIADLARKDLATSQKLRSPLDLRFTAVDGSQVDLSALRGKVVLLDFWATWCGPCRAELPNVLAAYRRLHDRGFEIVGISLDQDKSSLLYFTAANGMTWPQYFDGKGWQNSISSGFGIQSIPAMWLINKKGYVVTTNGQADLEGQIEKLLAEAGN